MLYNFVVLRILPLSLQILNTFQGPVIYTLCQFDGLRGVL